MNRATLSLLSTVLLVAPVPGSAQDTTYVPAGARVELQRGPRTGLQGTLLGLDPEVVILRTRRGDTRRIGVLDDTSLRVFEDPGRSPGGSALMGALVLGGAGGLISGLVCGGGCFTWDPYGGIFGALLGGVIGLGVGLFDDEWREVERPWRLGSPR